MRTLNLARTAQRRSIARRLVELQKERAAILKAFAILKPETGRRARVACRPTQLPSVGSIADEPDLSDLRLASHHSVGPLHSSRRRGH
jgi:hypothetical protein